MPATWQNASRPLIQIRALRRLLATGKRQVVIGSSHLGAAGLDLDGVVRGWRWRHRNRPFSLEDEWSPEVGLGPLLLAKHGELGTAQGRRRRELMLDHPQIEPPH